MEKASLLLEKLVEIKERMVSKEGPDLLSSQHELAVCYRDSGRIEEAFKLFEKIVDIRKKPCLKSMLID
jgi:tetratricopeptide (TPR) repeat protein